MKLILSSRDFRSGRSRSVILSHLPKPLPRCRVLFIPNEKWTPERLDTGFYMKRLREIGFSAENAVVFDPRRPRDYANLDVDAVYVSGGSSFLTLATLRRCAFDREIIRFVRSGAVYIGGSAGAHLVTQDLSHLSRYDAPPEGMTDFRGLGLFPGILLCHFSPDRQAHYHELCRESEFRVHPLTDEESLVFEA